MKTKGHKVEIRKRGAGDNLLVGANTEVLIDGKPVKCCTDLSFKVSARGIAKVTLTIIPGEFSLGSYALVTRKGKK